MAYTLTLYFDTEKEKDNFKYQKDIKPIDAKTVKKYSIEELNKLTKADLVKLLL